MLKNVEREYAALMLVAGPESESNGQKIVEQEALCAALQPVLRTNIEIKGSGLTSFIRSLERQPSMDCQLRVLENGKVLLTSAADLLALANLVNKQSV